MNRPINKICRDCKAPLMGIEIQGGYNGISFWRCPACNKTWDRWTGKEVRVDKNG